MNEVQPVQEQVRRELRLYERLARKVSDLLDCKGEKWRKLEAVRHRQRQCLIKLLRRPSAELTLALQRMQKVVCVDSEVLREFERGERTANIYVQVHPIVKHSY